MSLRTHHRSGRARIALATALALIAQPIAPKTARAQAPAAKPAATQAAAAPAAQPVTDPGWPRSYQTASGTRFVVYQPQVSEWPNQKHMTAYAAISVEVPGSQKAALGSAKLESDTVVSVSERLVRFPKVSLTETNFPTLQKEQVRDIAVEIVEAIPDSERVIALDRVLAYVDKSQILPKNVEGVKSDPPAIYFSQTPAVLVNIDGDPIWSPIKENDLKFAVNTNWDLFPHEPTKTFYLLHDGAWLKATDLKGAWEPAGKLPPSFEKLPKEENFRDAWAAIPGKKLDARRCRAVFVSTVPAEMILLTGAPNYVLVTGTQNLLWVSNTESDVFRMGKTGPVYYLVSGRWFSAPDFKGPWTFATPNLPEDFQKIPLEHDARACWRRCPARRRRRKRCCSHRCRRRRASTRRKSRRRR